MNRGRRTLVVFLLAASGWQAVAFADAERPVMHQAEAKPAEPAEPQKPATPQPSDTRTPVPSEAKRAESLVRVKEIYADDFATAGSPQRKTELARRLADQADETKDAADRWVLKTEALRLATDAGDALAAISLIERVAAEYVVDGQTMRLEALSRLVPKAYPSQSGDIARKCLDFARELDNAHAVELASKALTLAITAAKKSKNTDLIAEASRLGQKQKDRQKADRELQPVLAKLKGAPDDAELCMEAGLLLCFRAGRWAEGLPLLQKGADRQLAAIARLELSSPTSAAEHVRIGDAWWDWAETQKSIAKAASQLAASRHYASALPETEGLERAKLEKRLNTAAATVGGTGETAPLALLAEIGVAGVENGMSKNGTFQGKPFTCRGKKFERAVFTHPSDSATATISFRVPAGVRRLRGNAGVFSFADTPATQQPGSPIVLRIVADGEVLWTSPQLTKRDQMVAFDVDIAGCSRLELHTTSVGSANTSWGAWLDPVLVK